MPPVRTARRASHAETKSFYETPMLKILVGSTESPFMVNRGFLQATSFFAKHGPPRAKSVVSIDGSVAKNEPESAEHQNNVGLFVSESREGTIEVGSTPETVDLTIDDADYILKGHFFYTRDSFAILIRFLNDAPLQKPDSQKDCRALFKAYALAQYYDLEELQNEIIGVLQGFYAGSTIPISDVTYLIQHWGDQIECFLAAYLVEQTAYEMALDWPKYRAENTEVKELFAGGHSAIVEQLFTAAMSHAKPNEKNDPAKQKRGWKFGSM